jgi:nucleoside-diphosphate-sugar epimerase
MKILVTGSTGFVGRHLVPKLIEAGHQITEVTIEPEVSQKLYGNTTLKIEVSENQDEFTSQIVGCNPEVVIHLASFLTSADDYNTLEKLLQVNIRFFCRLLDTLKNCNLKLFINTGTFAEYFKGDGVFDPAYLYSATKTASRSFLNYYSKVYNFKQVTVVPYTIYGGIDSQKKIIDIIYDSLDAETSIDLSPGEQVLDFIHIDDVTNFYVHLVDQINTIQNNSNFQLGTGKGTTLKQLTKLIEEKTKKKANINWGGKPYRQSDVMYAVADLTSLKDIYKPLQNLSNSLGNHKKDEN